MAKKKQVKPTPTWMKHAWWLVPLLAILVYIPSFTADFTLDDVIIVEDNELIRSADKIPEIWTSHYWAGKMDATDTGLYRPLTMTTYALQYLVHGDNPTPFHILNILLHALTCFVLMRFLQLAFKNPVLTVAAGLIICPSPRAQKQWQVSWEERKYWLHSLFSRQGSVIITGGLMEKSYGLQLC